MNDFAVPGAAHCPSCQVAWNARHSEPAQVALSEVPEDLAGYSLADFGVTE